MAQSYDWDIYDRQHHDDEYEWEIHHRDCPNGGGDLSGDATAVGVEQSENNPEYNTACKCLNPLLGSGRE